jgi:hypothetical protein
MNDRLADLTIDDLAAIVKPRVDRLVAVHTAEEVEKRLAAANTIIAQQNAALAEAHAALNGLLRIIEAVRFTVALGKDQLARCDAARAVVAKIEGRS